MGERKGGGGGERGGEGGEGGEGEGQRKIASMSVCGLCSYLV